MALTIAVDTARVASIDEYLDYVSTEVDLHDLGSVAESAPMLAALANDRELVVRELNRLVASEFRSSALSSAQSLFLGRRNGFYVRANVWPSSADVASGRLYQDQFSYEVAHDHNYDFLTVPYCGPGYVTEIHEYDPADMEGYPGEAVDLRFLERTCFQAGTAMLYRASRDVHIQFPPEDLSVTLNLMLETSSAGRRHQYYFDLAARRVLSFAGEQDSSRRVAIVGMAGHAGNGETQTLLTDLSRRHPCSRTRIAAFDALAKLAPRDSERLWEQACRDPEPIVVRTSRDRLRALSG
ncbi:MAG: hypothetical protein NVS9B10_07220 [Nevskia sp.]